MIYIVVLACGSGEYSRGGSTLDICVILSVVSRLFLSLPPSALLFLSDLVEQIAAVLLLTYLPVLSVVIVVRVELGRVVWASFADEQDRHNNYYLQNKIDIQKDIIIRLPIGNIWTDPH